MVMVGEVRDRRKSPCRRLTGHLVMTTLHTNTAVGAGTRLIDMGVEPFLLSSSLVGVLAQRLSATMPRMPPAAPSAGTPVSAGKVGHSL